MISVYAWEAAKPVVTVILAVVIAAVALAFICVMAGSAIIYNAICYRSNK